MENKLKILQMDPYLEPYEKDLNLRKEKFDKKLKELKKGKKLYDFANGHHYFGFHKEDGSFVYREWAPGADKMYFTGDFCGWDTEKHEMTNIGGGVFEIKLSENAPKSGEKVQAIVIKNGEMLRRVPAYATRVVQDDKTYLWCAEIEKEDSFLWEDSGFTPSKTPFIYECHIGMAGEEGKVSTYREFTKNILPRVKAAGYNTLQIMAIMEHPYYGSFGYQVSSFFAPSSRFGCADDLKELVNTAHKMGIAVLLDVVHSHAVKNTNEGLNLFDGTPYQYFHDGARGEHPAWGTKLFDYGKGEVLHFLLSNLKYWMERFHFDGFRFDGVTSMLYKNHALESAFTNYGMYFSENTDTDAVLYLQLANHLIHSINKKAITISEDMSGMPGMCLPIKDGGIGFDFRLSMGVPDLWIKMLKEQKDDDWDMGNLYFELTRRREGEKNIGYSESHDQALVGDKTIMFRLCDAEMYTSMAKNSQSIVIDRGIALHKMIRLITAALSGEGYLNFMGNEFGHPEWIDFPREGNNWSYHYCRRQWSLADNSALRYGGLLEFDKAMISLLKDEKLLSKESVQRYIHQGDKVIIFSKGKFTFAFNFSSNSFEGYKIPAEKGKYNVVLSSDDEIFGGFQRAGKDITYTADDGFLCYLPSRTAIVFKKK